MSTLDAIIASAKSLPESQQREVLALIDAMTANNINAPSHNTQGA